MPLASTSTPSKMRFPVSGFFPLVVLGKVVPPYSMGVRTRSASTRCIRREYGRMRSGGRRLITANTSPDISQETRASCWSA